jgi:hypothetical protein
MCFFVYSRAHFVIGLWAVKFARKYIELNWIIKARHGHKQHLQISGRFQ